MIEINEIYKPLYTTKKRYTLITGGRGSLKSFTLHDFLVRLTFEKGHGILFTRYTMTSAHLSIIPEFEAAINRLGVRHHFDIKKTEIYNKTTGSYIWFRGLKSGSGDITANLKSLSGITTWVVEEAEDLTDEYLFNKVDDSIRTTLMQNRVILVMNPTVIEHWIYEKWFKGITKPIDINTFPVSVSAHPALEHIHSTYLIGEKYLSKDWLHKAKLWERRAKEGFDIETEEKISEEEQQKAVRHYINNYLGGWRDKKEGTIFNNWKLGKIPEHIQTIFGGDLGGNDPTTLIEVGIDKRIKKIYLKEHFYHSGGGTSELVKRCKDVRRYPNQLFVFDSAGKQIITELRNKDIYVGPSKKNLIKEDIKAIQDYDIIVDPESPNLIVELNNYIWNNKRSELPIDDYNHLLDAFRYAFNRLVFGAKGVKRSR